MRTGEVMAMDVFSRALQACVLFACVIGMSLPASAAELTVPRVREHHSHYRHAREYVLQKSFRRFRDDRYLRTRDIEACPVYEPAEYRPRVIGELPCDAARPYGLSVHLYNYN